MLECEYCDYLERAEAPEKYKVSICEISGHVFYGESGFELEEYPCAGISLAEYETRCNKKKKPELHKYLADEKCKSDKRVYNLSDEFWQYLYLQRRRINSKR